MTPAPTSPLVWIPRSMGSTRQRREQSRGLRTLQHPHRPLGCGFAPGGSATAGWQHAWSCAGVLASVTQNGTNVLKFLQYLQAVCQTSRKTVPYIKRQGLTGLFRGEVDTDIAVHVVPLCVHYPNPEPTPASVPSNGPQPATRRGTAAFCEEHSRAGGTNQTALLLHVYEQYMTRMRRSSVACAHVYQHRPD